MASTTLDVSPSADLRDFAASPSLTSSVEAQVSSLQVAAVRDLFGSFGLGGSFDTTA
jgi:hypothetical protein